MSAALHPTVLWAQRADRLILTIDLQSCQSPAIRYACHSSLPPAPRPALSDHLLEFFHDHRRLPCMLPSLIFCGPRVIPTQRYQ